MKYKILGKNSLNSLISERDKVHGEEDRRWRRKDLGGPTATMFLTTPTTLFLLLQTVCSLVKMSMLSEYQIDTIMDECFLVFLK